VRHPRFSWTLDAVDPNGYGQCQTVYRILVSSRSELLEQQKGDMWDSGWVDSDKMQLIAYEGDDLQSDHDYYWKVAVKDEKGTHIGL